MGLRRSMNIACQAASAGTNLDRRAGDKAAELWNEQPERYSFYHLLSILNGYFNDTFQKVHDAVPHYDLSIFSSNIRARLFNKLMRGKNETKTQTWKNKKNRAALETHTGGIVLQILSAAYFVVCFFFSITKSQSALLGVHTMQLKKKLVQLFHGNLYRYSRLVHRAWCYQYTVSHPLGEKYKHWKFKTCICGGLPSTKTFPFKLEF